MSYDVDVEKIATDRVHRYTICRNGQPVDRSTAWRLWRDDAAFRSLFVSLLADSPFSAYRWETPAVTKPTAVLPFEFVLLNTPSLKRRADKGTFAEHFAHTGAQASIVTFDNLGSDALLVVPEPGERDADYAELAAFIRGAPEAQVHTLWQTVGATMIDRVGDRPLWLSTAGGGVAWLHVRLDSVPKYYGHTPYRAWSSDE